MATAQGGYDYEFLNVPPRNLTCSICLLVYRDPCLTSCCGNHFCRTCISRVTNQGYPCPLCQESNFITLLDKSISRKVNELPVYCSNILDGCRWAGRLDKISVHLSESCEFVIVDCYFCSDHVSRFYSYLPSHKEFCPKRPYTCDYCSYKGTWEKVTGQHWGTCKFYPVPCPKKCSVGKMPRKGVDKHLKEDCPNRIVPCSNFEFAGCKVKLRHSDLAQHLLEDTASHLSLLASYSRKALIERDAKIAQLESTVKTQAEIIQAQSVQIHNDRKKITTALAKKDSEVTELASAVKVQSECIQAQSTEICDNSKKITSLGRQMKLSLAEKDAKLESTVKVQNERIRAQSAEIHDKVTSLERQISASVKIFPVKICMPDFQMQLERKSAEPWISEPFYSHNSGYKMCIGVYPNGTSHGAGSHVSVYVYLVKGEHDNDLEWPFVGDVLVRLTLIGNYRRDAMHVIKFDASHPRSCQRVVSGDRNASGSGVIRFTSLKSIENLKSLQFYVEYVDFVGRSE